MNYLSVLHGPITSPGQLWQATLGELQLQMTHATFDTWVKPTYGVSLDGNCLTVGVRNAYAKQWLETRLYGMIQRTAAQLAGTDMEVKFILNPRTGGTASQAEAPDEKPANGNGEPQPGDVLVSIIKDPLKPYIELQKYAIWYWQPILGYIAFATWVALRAHDEQNEGRGPRQKFSIEILADTLACHRQALTGRKPLEKLEGAFGVLNEHNIAKIDTIGDGRGVIYWARVLNSLPLLTPEQVKTLPVLLQERHDYFLHKFRVDVDIWEQLALPSLIRD